MRGKGGRLGFSEKDMKRLWKNHMEEIMNKENDWDHTRAAGMIEGPNKNVAHKEMVIAIRVMELGKAA